MLNCVLFTFSYYLSKLILSKNSEEQKRKNLSYFLLIFLQKVNFKVPDINTPARII